MSQPHLITLGLVCATIYTQQKHAKIIKVANAMGKRGLTHNFRVLLRFACCGKYEKWSYFYFCWECSLNDSNSERKVVFSLLRERQWPFQILFVNCWNSAICRDKAEKQ
jgi:hypothetical protein